MTSEGDDYAVTRQIQPHLPVPPIEPSRVVVGEEGVFISMQTSDVHPTWVQFDDDDDGKNLSAQTANIPATQDGASDQPASGTTSGLESQTSDNGHSSFPAPSSSETTDRVGYPRVEYRAGSGEAVVKGPVAISQTSAALSAHPVIVTNYTYERNSAERERPLTAKRMKILKVLSVVAAVVFFPLGLVAVYFAWRTPREFNEGLLRGNIDRAQKFARRAERLIILTVIAAILVIVLVLAILQHNNDGHNNRNFVAHPAING